MKRAGPAAVAAALMLAAPARADQVWAGLYRHDLSLFGQEKFEGGEDLKAGWIGDPLRFLRGIGSPSPHVIVSKNLAGGTDYAAAGIDWTFGRTLYVRPGIGMAVNDGPRRAYRNNVRVDLGSPITFEPELAFGWRVSRRWSAEASWIHLSHATLFSRQNRGLDSWGLRLLYRLH